MYSEDQIDWSAIPGCEWYRPENVAKAIAGIRNCDPTAPDILYQVANNHAGELFPAAVVAAPILLEIAIHSPNLRAATAALAALDNLVWFRGVPPFDVILREGAEVSLEKAIRQEIQVARAELVALADRDQRLRKITKVLLESVGQQNT